MRATASPAGRRCVVEELLFNAMKDLASLFPEGTFLSEPGNVRGLLAVILAALICGAVGSLVVGNRMAFFSDALAHCAFAGVALGLVLGFFTGAESEADY